MVSWLGRNTSETENRTLSPTCVVHLRGSPAPTRHKSARKQPFFPLRMPAPAIHRGRRLQIAGNKGVILKEEIAEKLESRPGVVDRGCTASAGIGGLCAGSRQ